ncbi:Cysteine desulfurase IscS [Diplonema papillatum]|nr:Cysteine desulfurase IscS [Diplonema papillatum]
MLSPSDYYTLLQQEAFTKAAECLFLEWLDEKQYTNCRKLCLAQTHRRAYDALAADQKLSFRACLRREAGVSALEKNVPKEEVQSLKRKAADDEEGSARDTKRQKQERSVYLDYNATTPVDPSACAAMQAAMRDSWGNPSSGHWCGKRAKAAVELSRQRMAAALQCNWSELFFTSGGTESNNLAILGAVAAQQEKRGMKPTEGHIITTDIEHPAVHQVMKHLESRGLTVTYLRTGPTGRLDASTVEAELANDTLLVSIMHANNETGVIQPLKEVAAVLQQYNQEIQPNKVLLHTDASQSLGKVEASPRVLNVDLLTVCSHKFYGPKGVGALFVRTGVQLSNLMHGAGHEKGLRPGTESTILVVGMSVALEKAVADLAPRAAAMNSARDVLLRKLRQKFAVVEINGCLEHALPNTLNCSLKLTEQQGYIKAHAALVAISRTVALSAGSACHSDHAALSPVHQALGLSSERSLAAVRLSTGVDTTNDDIEYAVDQLAEAVRTA